MTFMKLRINLDAGVRCIFDWNSPLSRKRYETGTDPVNIKHPVAWVSQHQLSFLLTKMTKMTLCFMQPQADTSIEVAAIRLLLLCCRITEKFDWRICLYLVVLIIICNSKKVSEYVTLTTRLYLWSCPARTNLNTLPTVGDLLMDY